MCYAYDMSRARPWTDSQTGETHWFDYRSPVAKPEQLELLAEIEDLDLDDLLDEGLSQRQVLFRLHAGSNLIPERVLERRKERAKRAQEEPVCRICSLHGWECEGKITRHHFVPRWLMRELDTYQQYAAKSRCTIPVCVGRHRDLHYRESGIDKSIVPYLNAAEKKLVVELLSELKDKRPSIFELIAGGNTASYEYQLVRDFKRGGFELRYEEIEGP